MAEAAADTPNPDPAVWRVILLLLLILLTTTLWEFINRKIEGYLRSSGKTGLLTAWGQLKFEILSLGIISLLLVVFEEQLQHICINKKKTEDAAAAPERGMYASEAPVAEHMRRLLASSENSCGDGKEPLWSSDLIHKMHILIFLISMSHILYAALSLCICVWSMRHWGKWEQDAITSGISLKPLDKEVLKRENEKHWHFQLRTGLRLFTHSVDEATYLALRRMRLEAWEVDDTYSFTTEVRQMMEEEFTKVVGTELLVWAIAIIFVVCPKNLNIGVWAAGFFLILSIIVGGKLHVIVNTLARHAYTQYKSMLTPEKTRRLRRMTRIRDRRGGSGRQPSILHRLSATFRGSEDKGADDRPDSRQGSESKRTAKLGLMRVSAGAMRRTLARTSAPASFGARQQELAQAAARALAADTPSFGANLNPVFETVPAAPAELPVAAEPIGESAFATHGQNGSTSEFWADDVFSDFESSRSEGRATGDDAILRCLQWERAQTGAQAEAGPEANSPEQLQVRGPNLEALHNSCVGAQKSCARASMRDRRRQSRQRRCRKRLVGAASPVCEGYELGPQEVNFLPAEGAAEILGVDHKGASPAANGNTVHSAQRAEQDSVTTEQDLVAAEDNGAGEHNGKEAAPVEPLPANGHRVTDRVAISFQLPDTHDRGYKRSGTKRRHRNDDDVSVRRACFGRCHRARRDVKGRSGRFEDHHIQDFKALYWFRNPQLLLKVFHYAYFENALSLAIVVFAFWQKDHTLFNGAVTTTGSVGRVGISIGLIIVDLVLLWHSAAYHLPMYVLAKASSELPDKAAVLQYAYEHGIQVDLVRALMAAQEGDTQDDASSPSRASSFSHHHSTSTSHALAMMSSAEQHGIGGIHAASVPAIKSHSDSVSSPRRAISPRRDLAKHDKDTKVDRLVGAMHQNLMQRQQKRDLGQGGGRSGLSRSSLISQSTSQTPSVPRAASAEALHKAESGSSSLVTGPVP